MSIHAPIHALMHAPMNALMHAPMNALMHAPMNALMHAPTDGNEFLFLHQQVVVLVQEILKVFV